MMIHIQLKRCTSNRREALKTISEIVDKLKTNNELIELSSNASQRHCTIFLLMSRSNYSSKSGLVIGLAITHVHRDSPFRFSIVDFESKINGDVLLLQLLSYYFLARHGGTVGHIRSQKQFKSILDQVRNVF